MLFRSVRCPDEVRNSYSVNIPLAENAYTLGGDGRKTVMLGASPENFKLELKFTAREEGGDFGVILRESGNQNEYYSVKFEPKHNRLAFDRHPRFDSTLHFNAGTERYCSIKAGEENSLLIIAEGSVLEVYVNDKVAMSERMFDFKEGNFGIYTHNTTVGFNDIKIYSK